MSQKICSTNIRYHVHEDKHGSSDTWCGTTTCSVKEALNSVPPATKKTREKIALYEKKINPISPNRIINNSIGNELKSGVARLINHHTFKSALPQISLLQVAWILTSDWIKLRASRAIHWSWAGKTRSGYSGVLLRKVWLPFQPRPQGAFPSLGTRLATFYLLQHIWVEKRAKSLSNSHFLNEVVWQANQFSPWQQNKRTYFFPNSLILSTWPYQGRKSAQKNKETQSSWYNEVQNRK